MCTGSPNAPAPPAALPEAPTMPDANSSASASAADKRRRRAAVGGGNSTILTGPRGVETGGATAAKTLLGQ
jgi:hypothetical protein